MRKLTKREALTKCREHWLWLSTNPSKLKHEFFQGKDKFPKNRCYACEYSQTHLKNNKKFYCNFECIIKWKSGCCMDRISEYVIYLNAPLEKKKVLAFAIVKLCDEALARLPKLKKRKKK